MSLIDVEYDDAVAVVSLDNPPANYFSIELISELADAYADLAGRTGVRAIVLAARGKHFCAGADFSRADADPHAARLLYGQAVRLFDAPLPVVAAVQGGAIGGGLGLALSADFRVATPQTWFAANFSRLGFTPGFGLTVTLARVCGDQRAAELMLTAGGSTAPRPSASDSSTDWPMTSTTSSPQPTTSQDPSPDRRRSRWPASSRRSGATAWVRCARPWAPR